MGRKPWQPVIHVEFDPEGESLDALLEACFRDYLAGKLRSLVEP